MPFEAIDLSVHNETEPNLDGIPLVIARICYGNSFDSRAAQHIANAKAHGADTGGYLFLLPKSYGGVSIDEQVATFLRHAEELDVDYFVIDWEGESDAQGRVIHGPPTKAELIRSVRLVQAAGHKCGVYASDGSYPPVGQDWRWIASYDYKPRRLMDLWQYQGKGLDRSKSDLTIEQFRRKAGKAQPPQEMKYILAYDPPKTITVAAGTPLLDLAYNPIGTQPTPTHFTTVGLADGHTGKYVVKVSTGRYAPDHKPRATWQIAVIGGGVLPEDVPNG